MINPPQPLKGEPHNLQRGSEGEIHEDDRGGVALAHPLSAFDTILRQVFVPSA